jgi:hypothetical protein
LLISWGVDSGSEWQATAVIMIACTTFFVFLRHSPQEYRHTRDLKSFSWTTQTGNDTYFGAGTQQPLRQYSPD